MPFARVVALTLLSSLFVAAAQAQQFDPATDALPMSQAASLAAYGPPIPPLTLAQQRARFEAEQRMYRTEWYNWMGYSPLRPNLNASYMSSGYARHYAPSRPAVVHGGFVRGWYW